MNGLTLNRIALNDPILKHSYIGCVLEEDVPMHYESNRFFIVNTENRIGVMGHWVMFFMSGSKLYFIDSFARTPMFYGGQINRYFNNYPQEKTYCPRTQVQADKSQYCGAFFLYFAYFLCKKYSCSRIMHRFYRNNLNCNDKIVKTFIFKITGINNSSILDHT